MRHMIRVLVGTMLEVAGGRRSLDDFAGCWRGARAARRAHRAAHGLYLASVRYPSDEGASPARLYHHQR